MANPEHLEEQREETRLIIEELLEDGSDPDALYTIEHHLSADDFETPISSLASLVRPIIIS